MKTEVTKDHARKIVELLRHGLVQGVGKPEPGKMCVEAAVCYALGEPHGDEPSCVGAAVRAYKIRLNDAAWPSDKDRAEGLREIAVAQLGSDILDQREFAKRVALKTIQQILPIAFRAAAYAVPSHAEALSGAAVACELATDLMGARKAALEGRDKARAANAADAAADAADADAARKTARLNALHLAASIGVAVLKEMGCKGCEWLDVLEPAA